MTRAGSTGSLGSLGSGVDSAAGAGGAGLRVGRGGGPGVASEGGASADGGIGGASTASSDSRAHAPSANTIPKAAVSRSRHFRTRRITAPIVFDYTPATAHRHQPVAYPLKTRSTDRATILLKLPIAATLCPGDSCGNASRTDDPR